MRLAKSRRTLFYFSKFITMKKFDYIILLVAVVCMVTSCSKKQKTREEMIREFRSELTAEDTTAMLSLCDSAMSQLKQKKIDQVIASLYEYNDSTKEIKKLTKETEKRYRKRFKMFPVLKYNREYFSFMLEGCNDVKYRVYFATADQAGTEKDPSTMFMFNPVKIDGEWKLCVKTPTDEIDEEYL